MWPQFKRAVGLDPNFAQAHAFLATEYYNTGEMSLAGESARRAYELSDRVTEHEKLGLEMQESGFVTGDLVKYEQTGELWKSTYPRDVEAYKELAPIKVPAARSFESALGCQVEAVDPGFESPQSSFAALWTMSYALRFQTLLPEWESRMDPVLVTLVKGVGRFGPTSYGEALAKRLALWNTTRKFFDQFELLLTPTLPVAPFAVGLGAPEGISDTAGALPPFPEWLPFTYPWNMTGQPAATVPCGFTREGLPVGLQIVGRRSQMRLFFELRLHLRWLTRGRTNGRRCSPEVMNCHHDENPCRSL